MKTVWSKIMAGGLALFCVNAIAITRYVDLNSQNPAPPYTSWPTAATNIQDAVDVAVAGDLVLVTNGVYQTGGRLVSGDSLTNRVAVTKAITLQSVNGPIFTLIQGYNDVNSPSRSNSVRCVYLIGAAKLHGFMIMGGGTRTNMGGNVGGGVSCASASAVLSNCIIMNNSARFVAGVYSGSLYGCVVSNNTAEITAGGGAEGNYYNCLFTGNSAQWAGAVLAGVGVGSVLNNCTIVGNAASDSAGGILLEMGTVAGYRLRATNSIVYGNTAATGSNYLNLGFASDLIFDRCCVAPLWPFGGGSFTNPPLFINEAVGDYRLQPNSPCINAGTIISGASLIDLDGNPRIVGGAVDIGAYEFQTPASVLSYAWAQQSGLPTDGSADFSDADGDGANNWQEWRADTVPTNSVSALRLVSATNSPNGAVVTWQSVATRNYWLERATNLGAASPFQTIATNIVGTSGVKTYTDPTANGSGPYFYRVGVQ